MEGHVSQPGHPPDVTVLIVTKETDVIPVLLVTMGIRVVSMRMQ